MKIFVTGITSFLGKYFYEELKRHITSDDEVYCLVRQQDVKIDDTRFKKLIGNLECIEIFEKQIIESDYVYHIAANATFGSEANYYETNFIPTKKIVDVLKRSSKIKNFIYISTIGAYDRAPDDPCLKPINQKSVPNPRSLYGKSKLLSEKYIKDAGIPYTIIRPAWIYGKDMRINSHINKFVTLVHKKNKIINLNFPGKVSLIHAEDLAKALVNALYNNKTLYKEYFASTESLSIGEVFAIIYKKLNGKKLKQIKIPSFSYIFSRIHKFLPITVNNLFIDYLTAEDETFWIDFNVSVKKKFENSIEDVIKTNVNICGYYVITGANSGIGLALAKKLNELGKNLILIDKNDDNLDIFDNHKRIKADLSNIDEISKIINYIKEEKIFCLINNAGIGLKGNFQNLSYQDIEKIIKVNVIAPLYLTKGLIDNLIKNGSFIVNITSSIAFNPLPGMSIYSSSKAFLQRWSESITYELRKTNKVITIAPSGTFTNFQKNSGIKILNDGKGLLKPEFVADKIIESIEKGSGVVILGFNAKILLFISKILPKKLNIYFWGKMFEKFR